MTPDESAALTWMLKDSPGATEAGALSRNWLAEPVVSMKNPVTDWKYAMEPIEAATAAVGGGFGDGT